jgi:hypothetical protein
MIWCHSGGLGLPVAIYQAPLRSIKLAVVTMFFSFSGFLVLIGFRST